jgi:hypothetical protein
MTTTKTGWEVLSAQVSERNGGLYVQGINHESTHEIDRKFCWNIHIESLRDARFDFSGCNFAEGAQARLEWLLARR